MVTKALVAQTLFDKADETDDENNFDLPAVYDMAEAIPSIICDAFKGINLVRTIYTK